MPAVVLVNDKGDTTWTRRARQMFETDGSPPDKPRGDLPPELLDLAKRAHHAPNGTASGTLDFSGAQGRTRSFHAQAIRLSGSTERGVVLVLNELTRAHQMEQLLSRADRLANIGTISASMAHEIRNAMVACRTFVELLLEKHQDSELAGLVRREIERMDEMIGRMLKHASTASGKKGPVRINEVLQQAVRLLEPQFAKKQLEVERALHASPDAIHGDEHQLQQAFMNLLLNACEAAPDAGRLRLGTAYEAARAGAPAGVTVEIADNGCGIPPENLPHLFEPFFTTKPEGTGLGLAVTHRVVQEHGGKIVVESREGEGASFRLFLPV